MTHFWPIFDPIKAILAKIRKNNAKIYKNNKNLQNFTPYIPPFSILLEHLIAILGNIWVKFGQYMVI